MNKKIEVYVDELFADMPSEQYVFDIKEELLSNLSEKYDDLITDGKSEEEAYTLVIASIGDVKDLFSNGAHYGYSAPADIEKKRSIKSIFVSLGISFYILSLAALFVLNQYGFATIGIGVMILICAIATGFIVYGASIGKTKYKKADDSFVENYKEKVLENDRVAKLKGSLSSSLWSLIVVVYLAASFITHMWSVTWIIFIAGAFFQQLILFLLSKTGERKPFYFSMLWSITVVVYFIISFAFNAWAWSWMIFLAAFAVQEIIRLITVWRKG